MVKSQSTSLTPANHADRHRHGGSDPITGDVRIDLQDHATTHVHGAADPVVGDVRIDLQDHATTHVHGAADPVVGDVRIDLQTHATTHVHGAADPVVGDVRIDPPGGSYHDVGTNVHTTDISNSWVDIDLSAHVGAAKRLCVLSVQQASGSDRLYSAEAWNDSDDYDSSHPTCSSIKLTTGKRGLMLVHSSTSGHIGMKTLDGNTATTVELEGYFD